MSKPTLNDLTAFAAVATHRSFRRAADELGLAPSSLSHIVGALERDLGVRLLNRTTRSVSCTEAGERLLARLRPVLRELGEALDEVNGFRSAPRGVLRINAPEAAARFLLRHIVPQFRADNPDVVLDLVVEGRFVDIVAEGFDAGVRLGEAVPQDMVAVRFGGDTRFVAVASPGYLERHGRPGTPADLHRHDCIGHRMPGGKLFRWEFARHAQEQVVDVSGGLILNHIDLMMEAAIAGLGVAYLPETGARPHLDAGRLETVLSDWCPPLPGFYLYYPGHRHVPAPLRAFVETLKRRREQPLPEAPSHP